MAKGEMTDYILDSFAVIAYLRSEPNSEAVREVLEEAEEGTARLHMHAINLGEVFYVTYRKEGEALADSVYATIKECPIEIVRDVSEGFLLNVCRLKATYPMSYADAFAAGLAIQKDAVLVTGDKEFKSLEADGKIKVLWIG